MRISLIVPVYQHWDLVFDLLKSLDAQTLHKSEWELLLVDNGSDQIPEISTLPDFAQLLHCTKPGSYAARNTGVLHAKGDLLVFTDADCSPLPDWLSKILKKYDSGNKHELIAGAVKVSKFDGMLANHIELYDIAMGLPQERYVSRGYAVTANLAIPKKIFEKIGLFDETRFSGGDAEICRRAKSHKIQLLYERNAIVLHPARKSWGELVTKLKRVKGGQVRSGSLSRRAQYFLRAFLPPLRAYRLIFTNKELKPKQKLSVFSTQSKLWLVEITEVVLLIFGKTPERR